MSLTGGVSRTLSIAALVVAGLSAIIAVLMAGEVFGVPNARFSEVAVAVSYGFGAAIVGGLCSLLAKSIGPCGWKRWAILLAICNALGAGAIVLSRLLSAYFAGWVW